MADLPAQLAELSAIESDAKARYAALAEQIRPIPAADVPAELAAEYAEAKATVQAFRDFGRRDRSRSSALAGGTVVEVGE